MNRQPSIKKILMIDYSTFIGWLFPAILWAGYSISEFVGKSQSEDSTFLLISTPISIIGLVVVIWRIQMILSVFNERFEVTATISNFTFYRDRARVSYIYTFQGKKYVGSNVIHKTRRTDFLNIGDQTFVMVDRNHPKRAFIRDLYL